MIKIKRGVKLPPKGRPEKYPFAQMKVNDMFEVPANVKNPNSLATNGNNKHKPMRFSVRRIDAKRFGCWRVK